eukprot:GFYU01003878.1.p1 GENE.GFYU01003878.1~~GFYU01003878.1.p1  ORF type:complete len:637 (-),score=114.60 GFYU01003878.1:44-1954(-)
MHGIKKGSIDEVKREALNKKAALYKQLSTTVLQQRKDGVKTQESLALTTKVLEVNPEFSTVWNFRREIIQSLFDSQSEEQIQQQFQGELRLTELGLAKNPKVYCVWHHRLWTVTHARAKCDLEREIGLCAKLLKADERNFHCWKYRAQLVRMVNRDKPTELEFTMDKINDNFSNYSAWHYRSVLLNDTDATSKVWEDELDLVQQAFFTEPGDQSGWLYHRWILGHGSKNILVVSTSPPHREDLERLPKAILISFSEPVRGVSDASVAVTADGASLDGEWTPARSCSPYANNLFCDIWQFTPSTEPSAVEGKKVQIVIQTPENIVGKSVGHQMTDKFATSFTVKGEVVLSASAEKTALFVDTGVACSAKAITAAEVRDANGQPITGSWVPWVQNADVDDSTVSVQQPNGTVTKVPIDTVVVPTWCFKPTGGIFDVGSTVHITVAKSAITSHAGGANSSSQEFDVVVLEKSSLQYPDNPVCRRPDLPQAMHEKLKQELDSCQELMDLDGATKWPLLTKALLHRETEIGQSGEVELGILQELCTLDSPRRAYYKDLYSQWLLESKSPSFGNISILQRSNKEVALDITGLGLTLLDLRFVLNVNRINISGNQISNHLSHSEFDILQRFDLVEGSLVARPQ